MLPDVLEHESQIRFLIRRPGGPRIPPLVDPPEILRQVPLESMTCVSFSYPCPCCNTRNPTAWAPGGRPAVTIAAVPPYRAGPTAGIFLPQWLATGVLF